MARLSARKSTGKSLLALMPPTRAAAMTTTSGRSRSSRRSVSCCRRRSATSRAAVRTSHPSRASRRTIAAPAIPVWPATNTFRPSRENGFPTPLTRTSFTLIAPRGLALEALEVRTNHLADELAKARLMPPAEPLMRLRRISDQEIDFGWSKIRRIDAHHNLTAALIDPGLVDALAAPFDSPIDLAKGEFDKFTDRMSFPRGQNEIIGLVLLDNPIDAFDIVARVAPVASRVQIAQIYRALLAERNGGHRSRNLARHESFTAERALMIEQNSVRGVQSIRLPIVHGDPISVEFRRGVGRSRIERRSFPLRNLLNQAVELRRRGLIKPRAIAEFQNTDGLEQPEGADAVGVGGVFGSFEGYVDMALRRQIIDFRRLGFLDDSNEVRRVGEIAVMEEEPNVFAVPVLIEMIDALGVE